MKNENFGLDALKNAFERAGVPFSRPILDEYQQERVSNEQEIENLIASLEADNKQREIDRMLAERNETGFNRLVSK